MTTNEQLRSLPLADGHLLVESVGNEIRFWVVAEGATKVRRLGRSTVLPGCAGRRSERVLMRERPINETEKSAHHIDQILPAPELTSARLYNHKNRAIGAALALSVFPEAPVVHLFYSGHGPSGQYWNFSENTGRYSFSAIEIALGKVS